MEMFVGFGNIGSEANSVTSNPSWTLRSASEAAGECSPEEASFLLHEPRAIAVDKKRSV
jgi:hypothetical protein